MTGKLNPWLSGEEGLREGVLDPQQHVERPSSSWLPMKHLREEDRPHPTTGEPCEWWENWRYYASVCRYEHGWPLGGGQWACIGVSALDHTARHDWRDLQRIKNDIVGTEWEAIELYPAESRLVDPSNRFYLWCCPQVPIGWNYRRVFTHAESMAPQRPFSHERSSR